MAVVVAILDLFCHATHTENQRERIVAGKTGDPTPEEIQQSVIKMLTSKTRGPKRRQDRISHGQISFGDLARTIAAKWKAIDPKLKAIYNHYAAQEKVRYKKEVVIWKEKKEREHDAAIAAKQSSLLSSSNCSSYNDSMVSMSSSITSAMSTSMSTSYNLSESINSYGGSSMQVNDDVVQRQQDILRQQMGFIDSKPKARIGGADNVPRELPKQDVGGEDAGLQGFQFSRRMRGNGNPGDGSMLDSNLQQATQKEQLLMQLQQQQLLQLQQLQQARNESSRLSKMRTSDTFSNCMQPSKMSQGGGQFSGLDTSGASNSNSSNNPKQILQNQFKELEHITFELDRLKEQERQMQQKIKEHQNLTNTAGGIWENDTSFGGPPVTQSGNFNSGFANLNDAGANFSGANPLLRSTFGGGMDDRQRSVRRSKSGDTSKYSDQSDLKRGQRRQPRRISSESGFSSTPNSFNYGSKSSLQQNFGMGNNGQQQAQGRRDSLSALLQLDELNNMARLKQQQQEQQQSQNQQNPLGAMMQNEGGHQDIGSLFTMDMGR